METLLSFSPIILSGLFLLFCAYAIIGTEIMHAKERKQKKLLKEKKKHSKIASGPHNHLHHITK